VRFVRFPPELARYQQQLAKARFYSKQKFAHPESTIRPEAGPAPPRLRVEIRRFGRRDTGARRAPPGRPASSRR